MNTNSRINDDPRPRTPALAALIPSPALSTDNAATIAAAGLS